MHDFPTSENIFQLAVYRRVWHIIYKRETFLRALDDGGIVNDNRPGRFYPSGPVWLCVDFGSVVVVYIFSYIFILLGKNEEHGVLLTVRKGGTFFRLVLVSTWTYLSLVLISYWP